MSTTLGWVIRNFGWSFVLIAFAVLALCIFAHRWGDIRLGPDDSRPDFGTFSWVSMMFAAGLGAGLLFFGITEPVSHWGFSGWAMYAVLGGAMAYSSFRKGLPTLVSPTIHTGARAGRLEEATGSSHRRPRHRRDVVRHRYRPRPERPAAQQRLAIPVRRTQVAVCRDDHRGRLGVDLVGRGFVDGLVEITVRDGVSPTDSTKIALVDRSAGTTSREVGGST